HLRHAGDGLWRAITKVLGEPAFHIGADQLAKALFLYELDAVGPRPLVSVIKIRIGEHELFDAVGCVGAEPLAVHAAHRQTAPVHLLDLERVEDCDNVAAKTLEAVGALAHAGLAVTATVVAHQTEV